MLIGMKAARGMTWSLLLSDSGENNLTKVDWYDSGVSLACCKDCTSMYGQE